MPSKPENSFTQRVSRMCASALMEAARRGWRLVPWTADIELHEKVPCPGGARQCSCRPSHAASGCISSTVEAIATTESRSGLSVTAPIGVQLRVLRDQRAGLRSRAWT